nr:DUF4158 domain-containing protein [Streptomyces bluensis]
MTWASPWPWPGRLHRAGVRSTDPELERFFFLDDDDRDLIALRRTDAHRLGTALQICTVRSIGGSWRMIRRRCRGRSWSIWPPGSASRAPRA